MTILVPGTVLNALQILTHLFLLTTWWGRHWDYHSRPRRRGLIPCPRPAFTVPSRGGELTKLSYFGSHGLKNLFFNHQRKQGKAILKRDFILTSPLFPLRTFFMKGWTRTFQSFLLVDLIQYRLDLFEAVLGRLNKVSLDFIILNQ